MENRDLVRQALDGDVRAYRRLIERYRNAVYGLAISSYQTQAVMAARRLQREGAIRPAPERSKPKGSVEVGQLLDFAGLADEEIQRVFREVDTKDLAVALKSEEPGIEKVRVRCYENISERVRQILETIQAYTGATEEEVKACQEGILKIVHRLQEAGEIRAGKKG